MLMLSLRTEAAPREFYEKEKKKKNLSFLGGWSFLLLSLDSSSSCVVFSEDELEVFSSSQ